MVPSVRVGPEQTLVTMCYQPPVTHQLQCGHITGTRQQNKNKQQFVGDQTDKNFSKLVKMKLAAISLVQESFQLMSNPTASVQ